MTLPCPTCGARDGAPCETFDMVRRADGAGYEPGPRYALDRPHALRAVAPTYWRAVSIRLALLGKGES